MDSNENQSPAKQKEGESETDEFVETMSEAFRDVFEFGPTVDTSSRPIDDEVAAAKQTEPISAESTTGSGEGSSQAMAASGDPIEQLEGKKDSPRRTVSDRGVDEVFDTLEEHSDPPW